MAKGNIRGAYMAINGWWKEWGGRALTRNREDLPKVSNDFQVLYTASPPTGDPIPTLVRPDPVDDSIPTKDEIVDAVFRLKNNKASGPSGAKAEHVED
jgi:hypothetical protein